MNLRNKRVLFICPAFYGYQNKIVECLKNEGAIVTFINDYGEKFWEKALKKSNWGLTFLRKIKQREIQKVGNSIDYLFVIRGECLDNKLLDQIEKQFSLSFKILYQWDSVVNHNYIHQLSYFDKVYTFDFKDSEQYKISQKSLFYLNDFVNNHSTNNINTDLCFVGSLHSDRYTLLKKLKSFCIENGISHNFCLHVPVLFFIKWWVFNKFPSIDFNIIKFSKLSTCEVAHIYSSSRAIVDINSPNQSGSTIRTIETVASFKKLITTNPYVEKELFYNHLDHFVVQRHDMKFDVELLNIPVNQNPFIEELKIRNWVNSFFDNDKK